MDLEHILQTSDKELLREMRKTPKKPHPRAIHPERFLYVSTPVLLDILQGNYRTHTFKFTKELATSIQKYGQLEPILLTKNGDKIVDTDGRGRFWSNFSKGADFMPVQIMYDVPELLKLEMEIDLNATKTKIDNEDIAVLAKDIFDGLVDEYSVLSEDGQEKIITPKAKSNALALTSEVMCRDKQTIRKYLAVADIDPRILEDNKSRRSAQSFARLHAITKTFTEPDEQWTFYEEMREQEQRFEKKKQDEIAILHAHNGKKKEKKLETLAKEEVILPKSAFYGLLDRVKEETSQQSFMLAQKQRVHPINKHKLYQSVVDTAHYVFGTEQLFKRFPELKEGILTFTKEQETIHSLLDTTAKLLFSYIHKAPPAVTQLARNYLEKNQGETFEEVMMRKNNREDSHEPRVVKAVSNEIAYLPLDQIVIDKQQLRSRYNQQSIDRLAERIGMYGQVKPGIVYQIGVKDKKPLYKIIVGNTRYQAAKQANAGFYKAFVCDDIKEYEIKIYQAIEDMFEQDTLLERSAMLHRRYELAKKKASMQKGSISIDDFLQENRHLGTPGKLKKIMSLLDLPLVYQDMIKAQLITPDGALAVHSLPEKYQMQVLFPLMTDKTYKRSLKKEVRKKQEEITAQDNGIVQLKIIDDEEFGSYVSYKGFYEELFQKLHCIPQLYNQLQQSNGATQRLQQSKGFYLSLAKTYASIVSLQETIKK